MTNLWASAEHALAYLARADTIPHRIDGERELLASLPARVDRVLDLGCGDGRLTALVLAAHPQATAMAVDFSPAMLERARERFDGDARVAVVAHNLDDALPALGPFDAVVSSFAIHHCAHDRKRALYGEVFALLAPGGAFANLEHVASPTPALHERFRAAIGDAGKPEDPSNQLLDVETQLAWLRAIGFADVDCHWKWLELALLAGARV